MLFATSSMAHKDIARLCGQWKTGNELEAVFGSSSNPMDRIDRIQFRRCMAFMMKQYGGYIENIEVLDVSESGASVKHKARPRYTIEGKTEIAAYCKANKMTFVSAMQVKHKIENIDFDGYGFKVKLSDERQDKVPANLSATIKDVSKLFRLKKRFSILVSSKDFRIDFTIVKSRIAKNLATANLQQESEMYEIEIEYVGEGDSGPDVNVFIGVIDQVLRHVKDEVHIISALEKKLVLDYYSAMVGGKYGFFIGPKPVTLEMQNMLAVSMEPEIPTILTDYSITEKADGESSLFIVNDAGNGYLMNRRLIVKATKLKGRPGTILDCEVITVSPDKVLIMGFDCYYYAGKPVFEEKLVNRLKYMDKAVVDADADAAAAGGSGDSFVNPFMLRAKEFMMSSDTVSIFKLAKDMLEKMAKFEFGYRTDGFILTPMSLGVGEKYNTSATLGGTWAHVFKWKPPLENTIDVMVKIVPCDEPGKRAFNLFVGGERTNVETYFEQAVGRKQASYVYVQFRPLDGAHQLIVTLDGAGNAKCINNDEIRDEYIVEIAYDLAKGSWIPHRVRFDKIEESKANENKVTANALVPTVLSVWRTIKNPITEKHITGLALVTANDIPPSDLDDGDDDDAYYARDGERSKTAIATFHNYWVKNVSLIRRFKGRCTSLFDVACGVGGDINKWVDNGFTTVVGVDISEDGIVNQKDGAYTRLASRKDVHPPQHKYAFVPLDSGKDWKSQVSNSSSIRDPYLEKVARVAWGLDPSPTDALKHLQDIATKPTFEVVSCQFAIHYFFENEIKLDAFIKNVDSVMAPGGYFIGTCFDGEKVAQLLETEDERKGFDKDGEEIWTIKRGYKERKMTFGQKITVKTKSINKFHDEYLVQYDLLVKKLAKYHIRPMTDAESNNLGFGGVSHGPFEDLFNDMVAQANANANSNANASAMYNINTMKQAIKMADIKDERTFSFLNMWFVFVKDYKKGLVRSSKK